MSRGLFEATARKKMLATLDSIKIAATPFDTTQPSPSSYRDGGYTITLSTDIKNEDAVDTLQHFIEGTFQVALIYKTDNSYNKEQDVCFRNFIIGLTKDSNAHTFRVCFHMPFLIPNLTADHQRKIDNAWECLMRISEIDPRKISDSKTAVCSELAEKLMNTALGLEQAPRFDK